MPNLSLKQKIMILVTLIGAVLILIFQRGIYGQDYKVFPQPTTHPTENTDNNEPKIVATQPPTLDEAIIAPTQTIEITFNLPLENVGEFKYRIDPQPDLKVSLSDDRQTAKIAPTTPFKLGTTFTLFILPDTKFDGKKNLGREIIYHFKTIEYKGV